MTLSDGQIRYLRLLLICQRALQFRQAGVRWLEKNRQKVVRCRAAGMLSLPAWR